MYSFVIKENQLFEFVGSSGGQDNRLLADGQRNVHKHVGHVGIVASY